MHLTPYEVQLLVSGLTAGGGLFGGLGGAWLISRREADRRKEDRDFDRERWDDERRERDRERGIDERRATYTAFSKVCLDWALALRDAYSERDDSTAGRGREFFDRAADLLSLIELSAPSPVPEAAEKLFSLLHLTNNDVLLYVAQQERGLDTFPESEVVKLLEEGYAARRTYISAARRELGVALESGVEKASGASVPRPK